MQRSYGWVARCGLGRKGRRKATECRLPEWALATALLCAVWWACPGALQAATPQRDALRENTKGRNALKVGDPERAMGHFRKAVALNPDAPDPWLHLARIYQEMYEEKLKHYVDAVYCYESLQKLLEREDSPKSSLLLSYYYHGLLRMKGGEYNIAIELFEKFHELVPDFVDMDKLHNSIGVCYFYLGEYKMAMNFFHEAYAHNPSFDIARFNYWSVSVRVFFFGYVERLFEELDDSAAGHLSKLRRLAPRYLKGRYLEGRLLAARGDREGALRIYQQVLSADPTAPVTYAVRNEMARLCLERGDRDRAETLLMENIKNFPTRQGLERQELLTLLDRLGNVQPSLEQVSEVRAELPTEEELPPPAGAHGSLTCEECHLDGARGEEEIADCSGCHPRGINIHPVGILPQQEIPDHFPLSPSGALMCRTCHTMHGGDPDNGILRFGSLSDKTPPRNDFCAQCHGMRMQDVNPHLGALGAVRCRHCHTKMDASGKTLGSTGEVCNFCHGVKSKDHPTNTYFFENVPEELFSRRGTPPCIVCHEPHGTVNTTHFLREQIVVYVERQRMEDPHVPVQSACKYCHSVQPENPVEGRKSIRNGGDINLLCVSCHVATGSHHPMGVKVPDEIILGLPRDSGPLVGFGKRVDCYTCHDSRCNTGEFTMAFRTESSHSVAADLCWYCHIRTTFIRKSPHVEDDRYCTYCHEMQPDPKAELSELNDVSDTICLVCHDIPPHPTAEHMVTPSEKVEVDESLPLGDEGDVVCSTCHFPHATDEKVIFRLRAQGMELCNRCHQSLFD